MEGWRKREQKSISRFPKDSLCVGDLVAGRNAASDNGEGVRGTRLRRGGG